MTSLDYNIGYEKIATNNASFHSVKLECIKTLIKFVLFSKLHWILCTKWGDCYIFLLKVTFYEQLSVVCMCTLTRGVGYRNDLQFYKKDRNPPFSCYIMKVHTCILCVLVFCKILTSVSIFFYELKYWKWGNHQSQQSVYGPIFFKDQDSEIIFGSVLMLDNRVMPSVQNNSIWKRQDGQNSLFLLWTCQNDCSWFSDFQVPIENKWGPRPPNLFAYFNTQTLGQHMEKISEFTLHF